MCLIADDHRIGAGNPPGVSNEPLVGLDRYRSTIAIFIAKHWWRQSLSITTIAKLAFELLNKVAAMGQDQNATGSRRINETDCRDALTSASRMFEPEPSRLVRIIKHFS